MGEFAAFSDAVNNVLWGGGMLSAFLGAGLLFTVGTGFFQLRRIKLWINGTIGEAFRQKRAGGKAGRGTITQFQALTGALAAAIGTGNIVGVASAILTGGTGSIFWMWFSALLGMMTSYAEKLLGIRYRYRDLNGNFVGGAMVYMEKGLKCPAMAKVYAFLCVLVSFGMGNLSQSNSVSASLKEEFNVSPFVTGVITSLLIAVIILGGIKRIAAVTEKLVPFMALVYIAGGLAVIFTHIENLVPAFKMILKEAFTLPAAVSGTGGYLIYKNFGINKTALRTGVSMGVFSNEAGIGSSVIMHCQAETDSPAKQGLWGIFEVFADTIVVCSVTSLAILCSGAYKPEENLTAVSLCSKAFSTVFGSFGGKFIAVSITLFAFATLIGWSFYGERALSYLAGERAVKQYKIIFILMIVFGSVIEAKFAWTVSEQLNALAAVPNLTALALLSGDVFKETKKEFGKLKISEPQL